MNTDSEDYLAPVELVRSSERMQPLPPSKPDVIHRPWFILVMLFCVMGALGIPLLWRSRAYSVWLKVVLSVVVILYTLALAWLTVEVWRHNLEMILEGRPQTLAPSNFAL